LREVRPPLVWTRLPPNARKGSSSATTHAVPTRITVAAAPPAAPRASAIRERVHAANRLNSRAAAATAPAVIPPRKNAVTASASRLLFAVPAYRTATRALRAFRAPASPSLVTHARPVSAANASLPAKGKRSAALRRPRRPTAPSAAAQRTAPRARSATPKAPVNRHPLSAALDVAIPRLKSVATASASPRGSVAQASPTVPKG
jgi:hypothetical protein